MGREKERVIGVVENVVPWILLATGERTEERCGKVVMVMARYIPFALPSGGLEKQKVK